MDAELVKRDFPGLLGLTYLDSAASSWTAGSVIEAVSEYYRDYSANVHRGIYRVSERATDRFEEARRKVANFIGAPDPDCCIFTSGTTDSINLVAGTWGETHLGEGDSILITVMEHHANLVPWQQLALRKGVEILWLEVLEDGTLNLEQYRQLLEKQPKLVCLTWVSNVFGTINPVEEMIAQAHEVGALVMLDGAQGVPHLACDVTLLGCDFFAFSAHKMLGPSGVGLLWARRELLEEMPPFRFGGSMILSVRRDRCKFAELPHKFEAGTPNVAGVIGFGAAVDYLQAYGMERVRQHEKSILRRALQQLGALDGMKLFGPRDPERQSGVLSFEFRGIHPHDMATLLERENICVRAGHHCCQPLMREFGMGGTTRASFYLYNDGKDIDKLEDGLLKAAEVFAHVL